MVVNFGKKMPTGLPKVNSVMMGSKPGSGGKAKLGAAGPVTAPEAPQVPGVNIVPNVSNTLDRMGSLNKGVTAPGASTLAAASTRNKLATAIPTDQAKMGEMLGKSAKGGMSSTAVNGMPDEKWRALLAEFGVI